MKPGRNSLPFMLDEQAGRIEGTAGYDGMGSDRHQYFGGMGPNGDGRFPHEMELLVEIVKGLEERGILVKAIDQGLVDFPHIRENGEEVYLCWKIGENDIHRLASHR